MVLDSSALVSIFLEEPGFEELARKIDRAPVVVIGAATLVEATIVLDGRLAGSAVERIASYLKSIDAEILSFNEEHYHSAVEAFLRFGKGRHAASLNFGDCLTYAIAEVSGLPLLYVGNDFSKTDIEAA